ncbi:MAG: hypothetical protein GF317_06955 [Candidatus Lokiarchaeota archaeon]|nr:hypothetical protein [Candidatus Lokiarchaeota archaeon]MBD3199448.1 hypothetical protein [Candidatus Lokiarchaeota archaeon]
MEWYVVLSVFDNRLGPTLFDFYPENKIDHSIAPKIANIMDQMISKDFFTFSFDHTYTINYCFELPSKWARGLKESLMLSVIFDQRPSRKIENTILTLSIEFSDWLKAKNNAFSAFYIKRPHDKNNVQLIEYNLELVKQWLKEFYWTTEDEIKQEAEEINISAMINRESVFKTLKKLRSCPISLDLLKNWYERKFPNKNFYKLLLFLTKNQLIKLEENRIEDNINFSISCTSDFKALINLVILKKRLIRKLIKKKKK